MNRRFLSGSITLSKLKSVITEMTGKDKKPVKGIFIPFDVNYITTIEAACHLNITVGLAEEPDQYDQIAFVAHRADSKLYKEASDEEKEEMKKLPFLGNLREFNTQSGDDQAPVVEEGGDLPW